MILDISTKEGYDIATALRGPDVRFANGRYFSGMKMLFTARLRYFVGVGDEERGWLRENRLSADGGLISTGIVNGGDAHFYDDLLALIEDELVMIREIRDREMPEWDALFHYLSHTSTAFSALSTTAEDSEVQREAQTLHSIAQNILLGQWDEALASVRGLA